MTIDATPKYGILETVGDKWRLVFKRRLPHAPEKVWRALVEAEHRDAWFPQRMEGELRPGAVLKFVSEYGNFEGKLLAFEPPSLLELQWGTDVLRLEVQPDGTGTLFTLSDTFAEQGKAARDAAGWHVCIDALEAELAGSLVAGETSARWQPLFEQYVGKLGPEAATIGPPPKPES
jgi:uncharacterized protein YndB with AHSA1/START domain